jgi:hypothetical protein
MRRWSIRTLGRGVLNGLRAAGRWVRNDARLTREHLRWLAPGNIYYRRKHAWRPLWSSFTLRRFIYAVLGLFAVTFWVLGIISFFKGRPWGPVLPWASDHCKTSGFGCNVVTQFIFTWAALFVGYWVFVAWRYRRVRRTYVSFAKERANELVETAGSIVGPVVGRDDLCDILQEDLRNPDSRQPHVLVGGLGIGKTAVLVQLTKLLAERGAVPVPIRLRDAKGKIDFLEMARRRFVDVLGFRLRSSAEAERVWHELRADDRVVVLADGLEEAFADDPTYDRDHRVRISINEAAEQRFPLIIASRPHEALRALNAAKIHLEPLSEEVALRYMEGSELHLDDPRLYWVIETAEVTETPLYLRIARELHAEGLLEYAYFDTRGADRVPLRTRLMKGWLDALVEGELEDTADIPLTEDQRKATVAHLEALACMGLRFDTQQLDLSKHWPLGESVAIAQQELIRAERALIEAEKQARKLRLEADRRLTRILEVREDTPRERDATVKAARAVTQAADAADDKVEAVRGVRDEARANVDTAIDNAAGDGGDGPPTEKGTDTRIAARLQFAVLEKLETLNANDSPTTEVLDMQAAASRGIQLRLVDHSANGVRFPHSIMQAFLGSRVFDSAFSVGVGNPYLRHGLIDPGREFLLALVMYARGRDPDDDPEQVVLREILLSLWNAAKGVQNDETRREVKLPPTKLLDVITTALEVALAIELAILHDGAVRREGPRIGNMADTLVDRWHEVQARDDAALSTKLNAIARLGDAARLLADEPDYDHEGNRGGLYECLYWISRQEDLYPVRLAAAQQVGRGGDAAWTEIRDAFDTTPPELPREDKWGKVLAYQGTEGRQRMAPGETTRTNTAPEEQPPPPHVEFDPATERRYALQGWLLPMLVRSIENKDKEAKLLDEASSQLAAWVTLAPSLPLTLEAALAQGFKHAANRRPRHSHEQVEARTRLQHHATTLIHRARFWYSRMSLLHSLCLLEIARVELPGHEAVDSHHEPLALVERWMRRASAAHVEAAQQDQQRQERPTPKEDHPFVRQAADMVLAALRTGRPERYIWIDESGVVSKIGSRSKRLRPHGKRTSWIPPSAGWIALDRRAKQLVADVQILLNLAERGDIAESREKRLWQTNQDKLPKCLSRERCDHLMPSQTVGMADIPDPGDECARRCPVELCPYPPRGDQPYRVELSEAFCRHQAALVRGIHRRATWQETSARELRRFWQQMEERSRK